VLKRLPRVPGVTYSALVPNLKGLERARAAGLGEAAVFISASETHSKKNINKSIAQAVSVSGDVTRGALAAGMRVRAYLSVVWGCPYEGTVALDRVVDLCRRLADMGIYQLSLGDTVGVGVPNQTEEILTAVTRHVAVERIALHLHDTRGLALANALVGLSAGVTTFDASIGGLGGLPVRTGAAGNLATEDVVNMLHRMGVETGIDLGKLVEAGEVAQELIGRSCPGSSSRPRSASGTGPRRAGGRCPRSRWRRRCGSRADVTAVGSRSRSRPRRSSPSFRSAPASAPSAGGTARSPHRTRRARWCSPSPRSRPSGWYRFGTG
jgi:hydroxymethylglutaryl-CoA lyase